MIDCTPEGHQPPQATRIFQGVQQPVCIVLASRRASPDKTAPARVRFRSLPEGSREDKFDALAGVSLEGEGWTDALSDWRAPFLAAGAADWVGYPALEDMFLYNGSGVMTGRTWVIAPDAQSLKARWARLVGEKDQAKKAVLFHPHMRNGQAGDKHVGKIVEKALAGYKHAPISVAEERLPKTDDSEVIDKSSRYAFRSFDRQFILADARLINQVNPTLWDNHSGKQVYLTALMAHSPNAGPALSISSLIPDLHHYKGSFGGRVFPLWADAAATQPNISPGLLSELSLAYGQPVTPEALMSYIAAVAAHPGYVERFRDDLKQPGLRIPLTADRTVFAEAVAVGREVIWLHTFGDRFAEARPPGAPRVEEKALEPTIPKDGALPKTLAAMPHDLTYDAPSLAA